MKRKIIFLNVFTFIFICLSSLFIGGLNEKQALAPINPEFLKYLDDVEKGSIRIFSDEGHRLGEIPPPVNLSHIIGTVEKRIDRSYPATYDLRNLNKLTPVKDQGGCGSCWAFATYGSLESYLMPLQQKNFSEQHLISNHGFDYTECEGGNNFMSAAYLARWEGPLSESDVPYIYSSHGNVDSNPGKEGFALQKHVQQVTLLPNRINYLDNDTIKHFVTTYGAVYISMRWDGYYYNPSAASYYCNASGSTNHGVAIVGWDDNYNKSNFNIIPPGDGAFIVRNSWGPAWGESGYFYLSYYDVVFVPRASFNNAEEVYNYSRIYQYDPLGWAVSYGGSSTVHWGANIFTALDGKPLRAVSFYTTDSNVNAAVYVYKNVSGSTDPRNGTLAASKTGTWTYPGYFTVVLDSPVALNTGEKFSVVIKFENSSYLYPIALEYPLSDYSSTATSNSGESFVSPNGTSWSDITSLYSNTNVCIKAFAGDVSPPTSHNIFHFDINWDGKSDIVRAYGIAGDIPVTGDWDGDGSTNYGIYRE